MTATVSAISATTPMSWVIHTSAIWSAATSSRTSARIPACTVTSSADDGAALHGRADRQQPGDGERRGGLAASGLADDRQRQPGDDRRDREKHLGDPHQHELGDPAQKAGDDADDRADTDRGDVRDERHLERRPAAVGQAGQHVAADRVGAEDVAGGAERQRQPLGRDPVGVDLVRLPEHRRDQREQDQRAEQPEPDGQ